MSGTVGKAQSATGAILLVGCGKMGGAMLEGWLERGSAGRFVVVEPSGAAAFADRPGVEVHREAVNLDLDLRPDVVVVAVKPQTMDEAIRHYGRFVAPQTVFLSIAAGKTLGYFARNLGPEAAIVRAMPNTPAAIGRGITVACPNPRVSPDQIALCDRLLAAVGEVGWVDDEGLIDAVTAVSGSGPAYVFLLVECMAAAGAKLGLPPDLALKLARATVEGAGELMFREPATEASTLRRNVTSPGGTTAAALEVLMAQDGLALLMERALAAAARRAGELSG